MNNYALVETKGTFILDLILVGPGGDGVSVSHEPLSDLAVMMLDYHLFLAFYLIAVTVYCVTLSRKQKAQNASS